MIPATVFFRGQVASVQARNSGGVKLPDGMLVLCALVDTSGYSTAVQQKYQGYFITEVALDINGQTLKPGAYGVGFIEGSKFIVMDLGAHDLFTVSGNRDAALKRPTPLQVLADSTPGHYRLYINRNYVVFAPAPASKRPGHDAKQRRIQIRMPVVAHQPDHTVTAKAKLKPKCFGELKTLVNQRPRYRNKAWVVALRLG